MLKVAKLAIDLIGYLMQSQRRNGHKIGKTNILDALQNKKTTWQALPSTVLDPLEAELAGFSKKWQPGVLAILEEAFTRKLSRGDVWQLALLPACLHELFQIAALHFKRGVETLPALPRAKPQVLTCPVSYRNYRDLIADLNGLVVMDQKLSSHYPELLAFEPLLLTSDERDKNLLSVRTILRKWHALGKPQSWWALGGGLISDLAGFAASLVEADLHLVPTTLLAMVDASQGGKTGINHCKFGKNQIGAFYPAKKVHIVCDFLATLPTRQLNAGAAECLKHCFLTKDQSLAQLFGEAFSKKDLGQIGALLPALIAVKRDLVKTDPYEKGERSLLNLGHSLAHALEAHSQKNSAFAINHGEAVALGLLFATLMASHLGFLVKEQEREFLSYLKKVQVLINQKELCRHLGTSDLLEPSLCNALWFYLSHDKKNKNSTVQMVLLSGFGQAVYNDAKKPLTAISQTDFVKVWPRFLKKLSALKAY